MINAHELHFQDFTFIKLSIRWITKGVRELSHDFNNDFAYKSRRYQHQHF